VITRTVGLVRDSKRKRLAESAFVHQELTQCQQHILVARVLTVVNASRKPGEWQADGIRDRAPHRDATGAIVEEGSVTAWLNGQKVQDNTTFGEPRSKYHPYRYGTTPYLQTIWATQKQTSVGPVFLQDHDTPVRFRNIWLRPLDERAEFYEPGKAL